MTWRRSAARALWERLPPAWIDHASARVRRVVRDELSHRRDLARGATLDLTSTRAGAAALQAATEAAFSRIDLSPYRADMTVHAAHRRDPRVQAHFAARGLPACLDCAVGADETLAEAAFGELFDVTVLVDALNAMPPLDTPDVEPRAALA